MPYVRIIEYGYKYHTRDNYRYPSEYAQGAYSPISRYAKKTEQNPLYVVIKNPNMTMDPYAFGDGKEEVSLFLEFNQEYDVEKIKSKITVYKYGTWYYQNGKPQPL